MKKTMMTLLVLAMVSLMSFGSFALTATTTTTAAADYGSAGALAQSSYTMQQMLTYAIQDEYTALAEYDKIMKTFNVSQPFSNIAKSETTHISLLKPLFEKYGVALPNDTSSEHTVVPASLLDAYKAGVQAEISNIAMYDAFLKQSLPSDVKDVFTRLRDASKNHLKSFENGVSKLGSTSTTYRAGGFRGYGRAR